MKRLEGWHDLLYLSQYLRVAGASTADTPHCTQKRTYTPTLVRDVTEKSLGCHAGSWKGCRDLHGEGLGEHAQGVPRRRLGVANTWMSSSRSTSSGFRSRCRRLQRPAHRSRITVGLATNFSKSREELGAKGSSRFATSRRCMRSSGTGCMHAGRRL